MYSTLFQVTQGILQCVVGSSGIRKLDGVQCSTSYGTCLIASVDKTMMRKVNSSKNLVSDEKCQLSQAVPHNSLVSEAKKDTHNSPKYRMAPLDCYTTIGEYFGKVSVATDVEITHDLPTEDVTLPIDIKDTLDNLAAHLHAVQSFWNVKRSSSEGSHLPSKIDLKRRFSNGSEEAAALGVSVDKGSKMRRVGNNMKSKEKMHVSEESPKTVSNVAVSHVEPIDLMRHHESGQHTSKSLRNDIPDAVGVSASQTFSGTGVQDPKRLGVTSPRMLDLELWLTSLRVYAKYNYIMWKEAAASFQKLSQLTGSLIATEQQQYQQQPVGDPFPNSISGNANSLLDNLLEVGRRPEMHSNITASSVSQTVSHDIEHSSQQRHLSDAVTSQPVLTNSTPVITVQASENQDNAPGVFKQKNGISSTIHSIQKTLNLHGIELLNTHHVTHTATESESPEKTVPDDESTRDTLRTGHHDTIMLRTYRKETSDAKSRNQSERVEGFGHTNDVACWGEVGGVQDAYIVENVDGRQDRCGVESGTPQKRSCRSYLSDPGTGVGSDVAVEDGNSTSVEVISGLLDEGEVTVLAEFVRVRMTKKAAGTENNRESEPDMEVVSYMLD